MTDQREPSSDDAADEALDRLLAQARWPEPSRKSQERLEEHWRQLRTPVFTTRRFWPALAAAAVITVAVAGIVTWSMLPRPRSTVRIVTPAPQASEPVRLTPVAMTLVRPATPRERLALQEVQTASSIERGLPTRVARPPSISETISPLGGDWPSREELANVLRELQRSHSPRAIERTLATLAGNHRSAEARVAAVRLLSAFGGSDALPILASLPDDPTLNRAALPGLLRLSSARQLAELARNRPELGREAILRELAARGDPLSTELFLAFILDDDTREAALRSLEDAPSSIRRALIGGLSSRRAEYRLAAARALGELCPHGMAQELFEMVRRNDHRREALAALLSCRDAAAAEFLADASRRSSVINAQVRALRAELDRLFKGEPA